MEMNIMCNDKSQKAAEQLIGTYEYRGNGQWFKIKRPWWDDADHDIVADSLSHSQVPQEVRERAYERFEDEPVFIEPSSPKP